MELKGSKTEANLKEAFAGESQARNKYTYFASKAKKDGFNQVAAIFEETANNEKEHAKIWFKLLEGGIGSTEENLVAAAAGEKFEWTEMYRGFAEDARKEGYKKPDDILQEQYASVLKQLRKGYPIRMIAKNEGIGISTVQRLKKRFIDNN